MSLLVEVAQLQDSLFRDLPELAVPPAAHQLHLSPASIEQARRNVHALVSRVRHTCNAFGDEPSSRTITALRHYCEDEAAKPVRNARKLTSKDVPVAVPVPASDTVETIEWLVGQIQGLEVFRGDAGLVSIGGRGFLLDIEPAKGNARFHYGSESKEAPWVVERITADLSPDILAANLRALAQFDSISADRSPWQAFGELLRDLKGAFSIKTLDAGFLLIDSQPPWSSILYDAPAELLLSDAWAAAMVEGSAISMRSIAQSTSRMVIEMSPTGSGIAPFRAGLFPPLCLCKASGRQLSSILEGVTSSAEHDIEISGLLREGLMETLLAPALLLEGGIFEYHGSESAKPQRYTMSVPSGSNGYILEHFDFSTVDQLKEALKVIQRQARLNNLFTSCFGPLTLVHPRSNDLFRSPVNTGEFPTLTKLLSGTWSSPYCHVDVRMHQDRITLSLPSHEGNEIKIDIDGDYTVRVRGMSVDVDLGRRVLHLSRGCVPLLLRKWAVENA